MPSREVYDIRARRAWPPVEVVEREEEHGEVAIYAAILGAGAIAATVGGAHAGLVLLLGLLATATALYAAVYPRLFDSGGA